MRSAPCSRRVAAGSANSSRTRPPIQALIASTWATSSGNSSATGDCTLACPASAGASATNGRRQRRERERSARQAGRREPVGAQRDALQRRGARALGQPAQRERDHARERREGEHAQAPHLAEARAEHVADDGRRERGPAARGAGGRALHDDPGQSARDADRGAAASSRRRVRREEALRRGAPLLPRPGGGAQRRQPDREQEEQAAEHERRREVGEAAGEAEHGLRHRARASCRRSARRPSASAAAPGAPTEKTRPPETGWLSAEMTR